MTFMTDNWRDLVSALALASVIGTAPVRAAAEEPDPKDAQQDEVAEPPEANLATRYRPKDLRRLCKERNLTPIYAMAGTVTQGTSGDDCIIGSPGDDTIEAE